MAQATFRIWRGDREQGAFRDYPTEVSEGMVVLDAVHRVQAEQANDLAVRWNCKAGKCGSCSAEINGNPRLMCMTRLDTLDLTAPVTVEPMRAFPLIRDLVTDVSWNFKVKQGIKPFTPRQPDAPDGTWRMSQREVDRVQEFRKCIECFLCQDVCHILRDHREFDGLHRTAVPRSTAPRSRCTRSTPPTGSADLKDRRRASATATSPAAARRSVPEHITITENAIIPLKERVVDRFYDPITRLLRVFARLIARPLCSRPAMHSAERPMFDLKPLDLDAVPAALARAERYRLLNEPSEAESICLDILAVDPGQPARPDHAAAGADRSVRRSAPARTTAPATCSPA